MIGDRVGSYEVLSRLGGGGVAEVYQVRHTVLDTRHALKVLKSPSDKARQRLVSEGRIQARLRHRNVVAVTDVIEVEGAPALLLDLVQGPTLAQLIAHDVRRPDLVDALGHGVLAGVAAAHAEGLVHRDLKPGNVLVALDEERLVPKVTDFGLALDDPGDERLTATGASLGTPLYMAPEQIRDARNVDQRSDVWALGVLLYELVVGEPPFTGDDRLQLYQAIDRARLPPLEAVASHAPARWRDAIAAALSRDPADRPVDAASLLALWGEPEAEVVVDRSLHDLIATLQPSQGVAQVVDSPATWGGELDLPTTAPPETVTAPTLGGPSAETVQELGPSPLGSLPDEPKAAQPPAWQGPTVLAAAIVATGLLSAGFTTWLVAPTTADVAELQGPVDGASPPVAAPPPRPAAQKLSKIEQNQIIFSSKALEKLLDGKADEAERDASMVVAGSFHSELPELVQSASAAVQDSKYTALYELGRGKAWEDEGTVAAALLQGMVAPPVTSEVLARAPEEEAVAALIMRLALLPLTDEAQALEQLAALDRLAPDRRMPALVRSRVMRRLGKPEDAAEALASARDLGDPTTDWEVEEALVDIALGHHEAARDRLVALPMGRQSPINAHGALVLAQRLLDADIAVDEALGQIGGSLFTQAQVHMARVDGAWRRGDHDEAFATLDLIDEKLRVSDDDMVGWWRVEAATEKARLAASRGDDARLGDAVSLLRALTQLPVVGWGAPETTRRHRAAEALLTGVRGKRGRAEELLGEIEATGKGQVPAAMLREWLAGGPVDGVSPHLVP